jgi:hypothetical protein
MTVEDLKKLNKVSWAYYAQPVGLPISTSQRLTLFFAE